LTEPANESKPKPKKQPKTNQKKFGANNCFSSIRQKLFHQNMEAKIITKFELHNEDLQEDGTNS
jgi:hypothetical protein